MFRAGHPSAVCFDSSRVGSGEKIKQLQLHFLLEQSESSNDLRATLAAVIKQQSPFQTLTIGSNVRGVRGCNHSNPLTYFSTRQILPGVRIIIANPETKGPLGDSHLGEV